MERKVLRAGDVAAGAVVEFSDGTFGVVLAAFGMRSGVGVDRWRAPPGVVPAHELVELVDALASYLRIEDRELEAGG